MSGESHDPGKAVEMPVEAEDVFDVMDPHDSKVNGIPCGQVWVADDDFACLLCYFEIHRQYLINDLEHDLEARLDGVASVDGDIAVEDLLQDLSIGYQSAILGDGALEKAAGVDLVRVLGAHQVHGNVRVDEDHSEASP